MNAGKGERIRKYCNIHDTPSLSPLIVVLFAPSGKREKPLQLVEYFCLENWTSSLCPVVGVPDKRPNFVLRQSC